MQSSSERKLSRVICFIAAWRLRKRKVIANVLPWIPVPTDERQQEQGSRAKSHF